VIVRRALDLRGADGRLAADLTEPEAPRGFVMLLHGGGQTRHSWHGTAAIGRFLARVKAQCNAD
jgi:hypothetical protein